MASRRRTLVSSRRQTGSPVVNVNVGPHSDSDSDSAAGQEEDGLDQDSEQATDGSCFSALLRRNTCQHVGNVANTWPTRGQYVSQRVMKHDPSSVACCLPWTTRVGLPVSG
eukprot:COSAG06_NODE_3715_length_4984_cov_3.899284_4_plen_111_part_00